MKLMKVGECHISVDKANEKEVVSEDEGTREMVILHGHSIQCSECRVIQSCGTFTQGNPV